MCAPARPRLTCESTPGELQTTWSYRTWWTCRGPPPGWSSPSRPAPPTPCPHTRSYELRVNRIRTRDQEIEEFVQHTDYLGLTSGIWVKDWYKFLISGPSHSVVWGYQSKWCSNHAPVCQTRSLLAKRVLMALTLCNNQYCSSSLCSEWRTPPIYCRVKSTV